MLVLHLSQTSAQSGLKLPYFLYVAKCPAGCMLLSVIPHHCAANSRGRLSTPVPILLLSSSPPARCVWSIHTVTRDSCGLCVNQCLLPASPFLLERGPIRRE